MTVYRYYATMIGQEQFRRPMPLSPPSTTSPPRAHGTVDQAGRITIPAEMRKALGLEPGTQVVLEAGADGVRVRTWEQTLRAVQDYLACYRSPGVSVVDEFLSERREEALREDRE